MIKQPYLLALSKQLFCLFTHLLVLSSRFCRQTHPAISNSQCLVAEEAVLVEGEEEEVLVEEEECHGRGATPM